MPAEFVARIVIVPDPLADGVPEIVRVLVLNARPLGIPMAAYVGVGLPVASGTTTAEIAVPATPVIAAPVAEGKDGATSGIGCSKNL